AGLAASFACCCGEVTRDDIDMVAVVERGVLDLRIEGDGHRGGKRPGSGGPDDRVDLAAGELRIDVFGRRGELVAHVDGRRGVHLVLDLGLGERGAVMPAPVDGFEALVDEALFEEAVEGFGDARLVGEVHGGVRVVPATEDAEALELRALQVDVLVRVLAAGLADLDWIELELAAAELLI